MKRARKPLNKKSKSTCPKGCKGRLINGRICHCLEKKLPKTGRKSVHLAYTDKIERYSAGIEAYQAFSELPQEYVIGRLRAFGLRDFEVSLLISRFYENLTFSEIVKQQGWTSVGSCSHCYKATLAKLRKGGFSIR